MKLDHDCVRDVLLAIEAKPYGAIYQIDQLGVNGYDDFTIRYAVEKLVEGGYIDITPIDSFGQYECLIRNLTIYGHEFLDNIRPIETWDKTKSIVSKVGSVSLDVLANTAAQVATNLISKLMGQ